MYSLVSNGGLISTLSKISTVNREVVWTAEQPGTPQADWSVSQAPFTVNLCPALNYASCRLNSKKQMEERPSIGAWNPYRLNVAVSRLSRLLAWVATLRVQRDVLESTLTCY
jgi:hypothetical protein